MNGAAFYANLLAGLVPATGLPNTLPTTGIALDTSDTRTNGMVVCQIYGKQTGTFGQDLIQGTPLAFANSGSASLVDTAIGKAISLTGAEASQAFPAGLTTNTNIFSARFVFNLASLPPNGSMAALYSATDSYNDHLQYEYRGFLYYRNYFNGFPKVVTGSVMDVLMVSSTSAINIFLNGTKSANANNDRNTTMGSGSKIFGDGGTSSTSLQGIRHVCQWWNRALSDSEATSIQSAPFTMLKAA